MRKFLSVLALLMLSAVGASAQSNITIDLGATYAGAFADFTALNPAGYNGALQQGVVYSIILNSSGVATITGLNSGQQYRVMVCKSNGTACLLATTNVTGAAQNISAALQSYPIGAGGTVTGSSLTSGKVVVGAGSSAIAVNAAAALSNGGLALGVANTTIGTLTLQGNTSGAAIITPQAVAGTPTITLGTSSGTPAVTASAPLGITTSTGNITCSTCVTTTSAVGTVVQSVRVPIANADLLTIQTTPVQVVAAPAAGHVLIPISYTLEYIAGMTPFTLGNADNTLDLIYAGDTTAIGTIAAAGTFDDAASQLAFKSLSLAALEVATATDQALQVKLTGTTAALTLGDGTAVIVINYVDMTL